MSNRVCVGAIVGAHGVRGAVRLKSFTAEPKDIASYGPVEDEKGEKRFRLKVTGEAKGVVIATLPGIADRNAAEALKGMRLYVPRSALPATEDEEEFYHADLIGLRVELADGTLLGTVKSIFDFGAGDVLELAGSGRPGMYLPFTKAVVPVVDLKGGRLIAEPPPEIEARPEDGPEDGDDGEDGFDAEQAEDDGEGNRDGTD